MSMTQPLSAFQDAFAQALSIGAAPDSTVAALTTQPGFSVYRNTVTKGCVDALVANYPAVARLVGDEWFRAAAAVFVRQSPPHCPMLAKYGDAFPDFLATFEPATELPYLPDVARLDRFWTEAHVAPDQAPVAAGAIAIVEPHLLGRTVLRPHASARWKWFAEQPIFSLWRCNREDANVDALRTLVWRGEGALVVRPYATVEAVELSAGGCAFIDACAAGASLSDAGLAALDAQHDIDLAALIAQLLHVGAFGEMHH
jgi:hypothetical protein